MILGCIPSVLLYLAFVSVISAASLLINEETATPETSALRPVTLVNSPVVLKRLAESEYHVKELLQDFSARSNGSERPPERVLQLTRSYIAHFAESMEEGPRQANATAQYAQAIAWNPIATFRLLSRMALILRPLVALLNSTEPSQRISSLLFKTGCPNEEDLKQAASSILRIQHVYDLSTAEVASGQLNGVNAGSPLSSSECNLIGTAAKEEEHYALAVEWFEEALKRSTKEIPLSVNRTAIEANLDQGIAMHDLKRSTSDTWDSRFFTEPVTAGRNRARRRTSLYNSWMEGEAEEPRNLKDLMYWGVCSGENYQAEEDKAKLFCYYETRSNPAWLINPLKVELLALQPLPVIQYHDLIREGMINKIKDEASANLMQAHIEGDNRQLAVRSSLHTWVEDNNRKDYRHLVRAIELITGLKVSRSSASEMLQVAAYTAGSHYSVHFDALGEEAFTAKDYGIDLGDRIATFLFYLSDVVKGGGTAFIGAGIAANPSKGSAVLWYNLKRSNEIDVYSLHAACPVILGEKWITNKWIHSHEQMFSRDFQCIADPDSLVGIQVNGRNIEELL